MKLEDIQAPPCSCGQCVQAGVSHLPLRRDPQTRAFLHGYDLKRWHDAHEQFRAAARAAVGPRGRRASGFERMVLRAWS